MKLFKKTRLDQKGFGHHVVVPVIVVLVISFLGYRVITASHADQITTVTIAPPTSLALNDASTTQAALTWKRVAPFGITYEVFRGSKMVGTTDNYTANYLDTGLLPDTTYTYTVKAENAAGTSLASAPLSVTTATTTTPITACGKNITAAGNYVLNANITYSFSGASSRYLSCISISNTSHVSLNCNGHTISIKGNVNGFFYNISNVNHLLLTNCDDSQAVTVPSNDMADFVATDTNYATVQNNTFGNSYTTNKDDGYVTFAGNYPTSSSADIVINNNQLIDANLTLYRVSNGYVGHNHITWNDPAVTPNDIGLTDDAYNIVADNTVVGDGADPLSGIDDNINGGGTSFNQTGTETGDIIANNSLKGAFDASIETIGTIKSDLIIGNKISDFGCFGIGGWYGNNWIGNAVTENTVTENSASGCYISTSPQFLHFVYQILGQIGPPPAGTIVYFENNKFTDNTFVPKAGNNGPGIYINLSNGTYYNNGDFLTSADATYFSNNTFSGNNLSNLSSMNPPLITPSTLTVDGGGNICDNNQPNGQPASPPNGLVCH